MIIFFLFLTQLTKKIKCAIIFEIILYFNMYAKTILNLGDIMSYSIIDYALFNANKDFNEIPFNKVDALIFAQLSYLNYTGIVEDTRSESKGVYLHEIAEHEGFSNIFTLPRTVENNMKLFNAIAYSKRYGKIKAKFYEDIAEKDSDTQFGAVAFVLPGNLNVISFRGTDATILGWKENCNMLYRYPVSSQEISVAYVDKVIPKLRGKVIITGHSKGGNLAIYSSVYCKKENKKKIKQIYGFDSPGFTEDFVNDEEYLSTLPKISKFVPEESMIGMLLTDKSSYQIVKSDGIGFYQHDPFMWQIDGITFVPGTKIVMRAQIIDKTFNDWVFGFTPKQREQFLEGMFLLIEKTNEANSPTFRQWVENLLTNIPHAIGAVKGISSEDRALFTKVLRQLFATMGTSVVTTQKSYLNKRIKKLPIIGTF